MRGARRIGPDLAPAEVSRAKRTRPHAGREPYERRILRDLLWLWLRRTVGLSDGEIALVCRDAARSRWSVRARLLELEAARPEAWAQE